MSNARAFPPPPIKWVNPDGTLTPYSARFLRDMFLQLGGEQPVNLAESSASISEIDRTLFYVMSLP